MTSDVKTKPGVDLISILLGRHCRMRQLMADVRMVEEEQQAAGVQRATGSPGNPWDRRGDGVAPAHPFLTVAAGGEQNAFPERTGEAPRANRRELESRMTNIHAETGEVTGTRDRTYDLIWYVEACLKNALRLENFIADAEREGDEETATLFRKAQADSRKGAEQAKSLLKSRLD